MKTAGLIFFVGLRLAFAGAVENAACEQTGTNTYRITFDAPAKGEQVSVYASSRPDRIDTKTPLVKASKAPVDVSYSGTGRVYFHLKPKNGATRVVATRRLPLEGAENFRDLGGYRTASGKYVRWGQVFRSNRLGNLTQNDFRYMENIGLKLVCDYRLDWEREQSTTKWQGAKQPEIWINPIDSYGGYRPGATPTNGAGPSSGGSVQQAAAAQRAPAPASGATPTAGRGPGYWWLGNAVEPYNATFRRIAAGELPMVFHCSAGKDRTGVMAALLLGVLGVPRDVILRDYLLSNDFLVPDSKIPQMAADMQKRLKLSALPDADAVRRANGVDPRSMQALFQTIDEKYAGSVEAYVKAEIKVSQETLDAVKARLLQQ